eukprot:gene3297-13324_t
MRIRVRAFLLLLFCGFQQSWLTSVNATGIPRAPQSPKGKGTNVAVTESLQTFNSISRAIDLVTLSPTAQSELINYGAPPGCSVFSLLLRMRIRVRAFLLLLFCGFQQSWLTSVNATGIPRAPQSPKGKGTNVAGTESLQTFNSISRAIDLVTLSPVSTGRAMHLLPRHHFRPVPIS